MTIRSSRSRPTPASAGCSPPSGFTRPAIAGATIRSTFLDSYCRRSGATSALNGICREVGWEPTPSFYEALRRVRPK